MRIGFRSVYGGGDCGAAVRPVMAEVKAAMATLAAEPHSRDLTEIRVSLFIAGEIDGAGDEPNGAFNYRLMRKARYFAASLTMHEHVWRAGETEIRRFLVREVMTIAGEAAARAAKAGLHLDRDAFLTDVATAMRPLEPG